MYAKPARIAAAQRHGREGRGNHRRACTEHSLLDDAQRWDLRKVFAAAVGALTELLWKWGGEGAGRAETRLGQSARARRHLQVQRERRWAQDSHVQWQEQK